MERVQEECKAFIEQYKKSECLWNTRIPSFRNQEERTEAYKALSIMFNMTVEQVKKRICNFRSRYSLEKIKIQESILQGHSKVYTPRISWFKYLTFLDDVLIQRTKLNENKVSLLSRMRICLFLLNHIGHHFVSCIVKRKLFVNKTTWFVKS